MPLDAEESPLSTRLGALNKQYETQSAPDILEKALTGFGRTALVSSFGADAVVLLHMVAGIAPQTPILFIDTMMLFPETLAYQRYLAQRLNLTDLRIIGPDQAYLACLDPSDSLDQRDPNACCAMRKTKPPAKALLGFDSWITGRKRFQSTSRADLKIFESDDQNRFKINPLEDGSQKICKRTASDMICPPILYWPRAIRQLDARLARHLCNRAKRRAQGVGAAWSKSNAAFILSTVRPNFSALQ